MHHFWGHTIPIYEQLPDVNNGHYFGIPTMVIVLRGLNGHKITQNYKLPLCNLTLILGRRKENFYFLLNYNPLLNNFQFDEEY
jgi:hypothetical protein